MSTADQIAMLVAQGVAVELAEITIGRQEDDALAIEQKEHIVFKFNFGVGGMIPVAIPREAWDSHVAPAVAQVLGGVVQARTMPGEGGAHLL